MWYIYTIKDYSVVRERENEIRNYKNKTTATTRKPTWVTIRSDQKKTIPTNRVLYALVCGHELLNRC